MTTRRPKTPNRKRSKAAGKAASRRSAADLQQQLDRRTRELARARKLLRETRQQQAASSEVLHIISASPGALAPVFKAIVKSAVELCGARFGAVFRMQGDLLHLVTDYNFGPAQRQLLGAMYPMAPNSGHISGRAILTGSAVQIPDIYADEDYKSVEAKKAGFRSLFAVPLLQGGRAIGSIVIYRTEPGAFTARESALLQSFADQAVIAIENARLLSETQEALEQQKASADILRVISQSPSDGQPVFQAIVLTAVRLTGCDLVFFLRCDGATYSPMARATPEGLQTDARPPQPIDPDANFPSRAIIEKKTLHLPDWSLVDLPAYERWVRETFGIVSSLYLPLLCGRECIGLLVLAGKRTNIFGDREIALAESFRDQAVIAIENARLFSEVQARTRDVEEALRYQTGSANILNVIASSPTDVQPVLKAIVQSACELCEAYDAVVILKDGEELEAKAHHGPITLTSSRWPNDRSSSSGRAIADRRPVHLHDVFSDEGAEFAMAGSMSIVDGCRTVLSVPLLREGEAIGAIVLRRAEVHPFDDKQIGLLQTFADQAVIAIENTRLFNESQVQKREALEALEHQTATSAILEVISRSPSDTQPVFDAIVESAARLCEAVFSVVWRYDGELLHYVASHNFTPEVHRRLLQTYPKKPDRSVAAGRAILDAAIAEVPDMLADPTYAHELAMAGNWRASFAVPMLHNGVPIGAISLGKTEARPFSPRQIQLLMTFADQAVIAIENVRLFNETKEALERQTATAEILRVIAGSPTDVQPVFDAIAESARRLLGSHTAVVTRVIDDVIHLAASTAESEAPAHAAQGLLPYPLSSDRIHARVARTGQLAVNTDVLNSDLPQGVKELARTVGWRSMLVVPMLRNGIAIGTIGITRREPGSFDDTTVDLLKTFADQAVIAIENARLFDETNEALARQTATSDVLKVIASSPSNLQPVFDAIAERSKALIGAHSTTVVRYVGGMIELAAFTPVSPDADAALLTLFPRRPTAEHDVVLRGEIARIHDAEAELQGNVMLDAARARGWRSRLHVPLKDDTGVIGWISITRKEAGGFADKDVELLQTFADQAVIAIQNVELFEEVQARTRELSQSLDDLRSAQDRLVQTEKLASLGQLTAGIAHEIKNPLNFVNNFSTLSVELTDELKEALMRERLTDKGREELDELTRVLKDNLGKVVQHGKRADSIVKNMLQHSREGSGERRSADINALVGESLNLAYHGARAEKAGFNITLEHDLDPEAGAADLYPQEITRALLNLISNGFYAATRRKAETGDETFEPVLSAGTRNLGKAVEIRIRDNGTGIATEVREKIFNPFFTTKPTGEGTGLGLSMAHDIIVKQHGGRIDVETVPGAFTEFIITLPRDNGAAVGRKPE